MFGYVRANEATLGPAQKRDYEAAYCGVCHAMKRRCGRFSRLFLNYDFVFLAMLLTSGPGEYGREKCFLHPCAGKCACPGGAGMDRAADEAVVLTWWKLRDAISDGGLFTRLAGRVLCLCLRSGYRRAAAACPAFDGTVREELAGLHALETVRSASIDRTADAFARLLAAAAPGTGESGRDRAMGQTLYHLGRWIYLIDAVDDLEKDKQKGRYNPVALRYPEWGGSDRAALGTSLRHSLYLASSAAQLLDLGGWTPVVENILRSGLPGVQELVFQGKWREFQKRHRRTHE